MIILLTILRLIPYAMVLVIAWQKGFWRLSVVAGLTIASAIFSITMPLPPEVQQVLNSLFAVMLLFHALDLRQR